MKINQRINTLEEKRIKNYCIKKGIAKMINQNDLQEFLDHQLEVVSVDMKQNFKSFSWAYCDDECVVTIATSNNIKFDLVFDYCEGKKTFYLDDEPYENNENLKYWIVVEYTKELSKRFQF